MQMDDRDLIRRFLGEPGIDAAARARARNEVDRVLANRRRSPRPWGLVAAAVAALLLASLVWSTSASPSAAAKEFEALATIPTTALKLGPDDYLYRVSEELNLRASGSIESGGEVRAQVRMATEQWLRIDGSGQRRSLIEDVTFPTPEDERGWAQLGPSALPAVGETELDPLVEGEGLLVDIGEIPTDPVALLTSLRDGSIRDYGRDDASVFELIGDLLAQGNLPAATRSALLEAAGRLDGVRLLGTAADPLGRAGEAFSVQALNVETRLVFDPATGGLLAIETLSPLADGSWQITDWRAFLSTDVVDRIPPWPGADQAG
jgi:hypothetical protein